MTKHSKCVNVGEYLCKHVVKFSEALYGRAVTSGNLSTANYMVQDWFHFHDQI